MRTGPVSSRRGPESSLRQFSQPLVLTLMKKAFPRETQFDGFLWKNMQTDRSIFSVTGHTNDGLHGVIPHESGEVENGVK